MSINKKSSTLKDRMSRSAKIRLEKRYEGKPCSKGHTTRYKANGNCVACCSTNRGKSATKAPGLKPSRMVDIDHLREQLAEAREE